MRVALHGRLLVEHAEPGPAERPALGGARGLGDLDDALRVPAVHREIVRVLAVRDARHRKPQAILHARGRDRRGCSRSAGLRGCSPPRPSAESARRIALERGAPAAPELRVAVRVERPAERLVVQGVDLRDHAAADEAALRIARVQVVDRRLRLEAGVGARRAHPAGRPAPACVWKVRFAPTRPLPVGEPVRERAGRREQQQLRRADRVRGQHDLARAHLLLAALRVEVARAGDAPVARERNLEDARVRTQIESARRERARNRDREGGSLRVDRAAVGATGAAVEAARAPGVGARVDRDRHRKGSVAELARRGGERRARRARRVRGIRVGLAARRFERVRARLARHAEIDLGLLVERLEIRVRDRPVGEARARHRPVRREHAEIVLPEAPGPRGPVRHRPAHAVRELVEAPGLGRAVRVEAIRLDLLGREHAIAYDVRELVVVELRGLELRPALERHDPEARRREPIEHHAAAGARPDHADVEKLGGRQARHDKAIAGRITGISRSSGMRGSACASVSTSRRAPPPRSTRSSRASSAPRPTASTRRGSGRSSITMR